MLGRLDELARDLCLPISVSNETAIFIVEAGVFRGFLQYSRGMLGGGIPGGILEILGWVFWGVFQGGILVIRGSILVILGGVFWGFGGYSRDLLGILGGVLGFFWGFFGVFQGFIGYSGGYSGYLSCPVLC